MDRLLIIRYIDRKIFARCACATSFSIHLTTHSLPDWSDTMFDFVSWQKLDGSYDSLKRHRPGEDVFHALLIRDISFSFLDYL